MKTLILALTLILGLTFTAQAQNASAYFSGKGKVSTLTSGSQVVGKLYLKDDRGFVSYDSLNLVLSVDDSADIVLQIYAVEPLAGEGVADTITINPTAVAGEMINLAATGAHYHFPWHNFIAAISTIQCAKGIEFRVRTRDDSGTYTDDPTLVYLYFKAYR